MSLSTSQITPSPNRTSLACIFLALAFIGPRQHKWHDNPLLLAHTWTGDADLALKEHSADSCLSFHWFTSAWMTTEPRTRIPIYSRPPNRFPPQIQKYAQIRGRKINKISNNTNTVQKSQQFHQSSSFAAMAVASKRHVSSIVFAIILIGEHFFLFFFLNICVLFLFSMKY